MFNILLNGVIVGGSIAFLVGVGKDFALKEAKKEKQAKKED